MNLLPVARSGGRRWRILAAIILSVGFAPLALAQQASIEGVVRDALGRPLAGAAVALESADGKTVAKTASDNGGHFAFSGVSAGTYAIVVTKADYETGTTVVSVETSGSANIELVLQASKPLDLAVVSKRLDESRSNLNPSTGASTYTIGSDAIQDMPQGANTPFNQVLLRAPGVAADTAAAGQFHIRGEHTHVQTRINGILLPEGIIGFGPVLDSAIVDRVQVITGALPAQYGFRTGGVVDVRTKSGAFAPGGYVDLSGGTNETLNPSLAYGGSSNAFNYFVTGSYLATNQGIEGPTSAFEPLHDHSEQDKGFGYFSYLVNPTTRLTSIIGAAVNDFQIPNNPGQTACGWASSTSGPNCNPLVNGTAAPTVSSSSLNARQREENYFGTVAMQGIAGESDYQIAAYSRYSLLHYIPDRIGELEFNGAATDALRTNYATGAQGDLSYRLGDSHTLRTGFLAEQTVALARSIVAVFPATPNPDGSYDQLSNATQTIGVQSTKVANLSGLYVQDEWKLSPELILNYGARYDVSDAFLYESQWSPRLGIVYLPAPQWTLHAGYARTFTPPPLQFVGPSTVSAFGGTSNQPLVTAASPVRSERGDSYDAGVVYKPTERVTIGWDNYYKESRHILDEGQFGAALVLTSINYAEGITYGSELTASYDDPRVEAFANFAYNYNAGKKVESGQFNFTPDEIAYLNDHFVQFEHVQTYTASWGASYRLEQDTRIGFDALYGSGQHHGFANKTVLPDYTIFNAFATQHLHVIDDNGLDLRFSVLNAFDEVYELRDGTGIGVGAKQFGPRVGYFVGVRKAL